MSEARSRKAFWAAFLLLSGLAALPIWWVDYLPQVDLPQHEALVSILRHWADPACGYPQIYEIRWFTPYWLGYAVAWALSTVFGVASAVKIVFTAVVIAIPLVTRRLLRAVGGDEWWVLLLLPLGFGFPASWGFFSFLTSVPLVLLFLVTANRYVRSPSLGSGVRTALFALFLFVAHALAVVFAVVLLAALVTTSRQRWRDRLSGLWPAAPATLLLALWTALRPDAEQQGKSLYLLGFDRVTDLPVGLTGIPQRGLAWLAVLALVASLTFCGARFSRDRTRLAPLVLTAAIVLCAPNMALGTAYLAPRFVIFLLPLGLLALHSARSNDELRIPRGVIVVVATLLLGVVQYRYAGMNREGEGLIDVFAAAPEGERLLYLDFDRVSRYSPDPVFLHSGSRYLNEHCGEIGVSFLDQYVQMPVRRKIPSPSKLPRHLESMPQLFKWEKHGGDSYGLLLVRAPGEPDVARIAGGAAQLGLLAHRGRWWLFENPGPAVASSPTSQR